MDAAETLRGDEEGVCGGERVGGRGGRARRSSSTADRELGRTGQERKGSEGAEGSAREREEEGRYGIIKGGVGSSGIDFNDYGGRSTADHGFDSSAGILIRECKSYYGDLETADSGPDADMVPKNDSGGLSPLCCLMRGVSAVHRTCVMSAAVLGGCCCRGGTTGFVMSSFVCVVVKVNRT